MLTLMTIVSLFIGISSFFRHEEKRAKMRQEIIGLYKSGASEQEVIAKALEYKYGGLNDHGS